MDIVSYLDDIETPYEAAPSEGENSVPQSDDDVKPADELEVEPELEIDHRPKAEGQHQIDVHHTVDIQPQTDDGDFFSDETAESFAADLDRALFNPFGNQSQSEDSINLLRRSVWGLWRDFFLQGSATIVRGLCYRKCRAPSCSEFNVIFENQVTLLLNEVIPRAWGISSCRHTLKLPKFIFKLFFSNDPIDCSFRIEFTLDMFRISSTCDTLYEKDSTTELDFNTINGFCQVLSFFELETHDSSWNDVGSVKNSIWKHFTISQDKTSVAFDIRELLFVAGPRNYGWDDNALSLHASGTSSPVSTASSTEHPRYHNNLQLEQASLAANNSSPDQMPPQVESKAVTADEFRDGWNEGDENSLQASRSVQGCGGQDGDLRSAVELRPLGAESHPYTTPNTKSPVGERSEDELRRQIATLEKENQSLMAVREANSIWKQIYVVRHDSKKPTHSFLDEPFWSVGPTGEPFLDGQLPVVDVDAFLQRRRDIAFVICTYYSSTQHYYDVLRASRTRQPLPDARAYKEVITFNSPGMVAAVQSFIDLQPNFKNEFPRFDVHEAMQAPYLFWYRYRSTDALSGLKSCHKALMQPMAEWIEGKYRHLYALAESQIKRGIISQATMAFLIKPGDILIGEKKGKLVATIVKTWPEPSIKLAADQTQLQGPQRGQEANKPKQTFKWTADCWTYIYDGRFRKSQHTLDITFKASSEDEEVSIRTLSAYPLQHAQEHVRTTLEKRGRTFWKCRHRSIVSYIDSTGLYGSGDRFVVDFQTYRQLHDDSPRFRQSYSDNDDPDQKYMDPEVMEAEEPPPSPDIYVFPQTIQGYDLRSKKWEDLDVDSICDVTWNKKSFEHLVVDPQTKELIQALVMRQIAREKSTDIIERKGNGLIILLHGGPGTGKTFTAESVAELAEKPLFRVTCGDIGTEPEKVEKYLESVLHLGKTWGCVVLIDEAEVFLEQRSLDNLERNALVSVFLRVLEYYEGILILTSNRVGTFDEAFKSRILLSLHYDNLTQGQRMKIWRNFLNRLKEMKNSETDKNQPASGPGSGKLQEEDGEIDFNDVECYLQELSQYDLNGRQIRNAITSARQLAMFRNQPMSYEHLKHVINVSSKFDKYLKSIQEGQTDDQIARSDGVR